MLVGMDLTGVSVLAVYPDGRLVGKQGRNAGELMREGTPRAAKLASLTDRIADVQLGDQLDVDWDGKYWWVSREGERIGRLTWPASSRGKPDPRVGVPMHMIERGTLDIYQLLIGDDDAVVNCGGSVRPRD